MFEAAYVGNYGYDIEINRNINALPIQYLNTDNSRTAAMDANNTFLTTSVANPFAGLLPGTSFNNATISRSQLMRPYPQFGDITTTNNDGKSWYNGFQAGVQKQFRQGYTLGLSYTRSKWMQQTEYLNAADATPTKMISDLDVPTRLSISGIYALPFGQGKRFGSNASRLTDAFIGGWQIQGVYTYQAGFPVGFGNDGFYNGTGDGSDIALDNKTTSKWFNTDVFTSLLNSTSTLSTPVNHRRTMLLRYPDVRRDSINNMDFSLLKNVKFTSGQTFQFRLEFINVLNQPYFPAPISSMTSATFGQVTASNQSNYARRAQVGFKLHVLDSTRLHGGSRHPVPGAPFSYRRAGAPAGTGASGIHPPRRPTVTPRHSPWRLTVLIIVAAALAWIAAPSAARPAGPDRRCVRRSGGPGSGGIGRRARDFGRRPVRRHGDGHLARSRHD